MFKNSKKSNRMLKKVFYCSNNLKLNSDKCNKEIKLKIKNLQQKIRKILKLNQIIFKQNKIKQTKLSLIKYNMIKYNNHKTFPKILNLKRK